MPVYLVIAQDLERKNIIFKRIVYARSPRDVIPTALYEENKERSFENRLLRSKQYYGIQTLVPFVPDMDDPRILSYPDQEEVAPE